MTYIIPSSMHCPIPSTCHAKLIWYQKNIIIIIIIISIISIITNLVAKSQPGQCTTLRSSCSVGSSKRPGIHWVGRMPHLVTAMLLTRWYKMFMWHPASGILLSWSNQSWLGSLSAFSLWKRERETSLQKAYVSVLFYCMYYKRGHPKNTLHSQDRSSCSDEPLGPVCAATSYHRVATICRPKTSNPRSWHLFNFGGNESWNPTAWTNPFNNPWVKSVGIGNYSKFEVICLTKIDSILLFVHILQHNIAHL